MAVEINTALDWAQEHIFSLGLHDSGSQLCQANMGYGLAKIQYLQKSLGLLPNASFIGSPDMTITRNNYRWTSGFGYGGKLSFGDGSSELIILDLKPNACGMLVGGLEHFIPAERLLERIMALKELKETIQGAQIQLDFAQGNHFINLFSCRESRVKLPPYIFVVHGAGGEYRGDQKGSFGLYWDQSPRLMQITEIFSTPWGELKILTNDRAREYYQFYQFVEEFSKKRREMVAERIFGPFLPISNENHQGFINMNEMVLGSHYFKEKNKTLYPVMLRADLPAYLLWGKENISPEQLEKLGFNQRAFSPGIRERLLGANLLPHGGGYYFPRVSSIRQIFQLQDSRFFQLHLTDSTSTLLVSAVKDIPYAYRGEEVISQTLTLDLGEKAATLIPIYSFKI